MKIEFDDKVDYFLEVFRDGQWKQVAFSQPDGELSSHIGTNFDARAAVREIKDCPARVMMRRIRETHESLHTNNFVSDQNTR